MIFPQYRGRRLRRNARLRALVRETRLSVEQLVYPIFVVEGKGVKRPIEAMPGLFQFSVDKLVDEVKEARDLGIPAILLFGIPAKKDELGREAYAKDGIVQRALRRLKEEVAEVLLITDVCLCEYTSHGHCGMVKDGVVLNDPTLEILAEAALSHARAGADIVAPSDMMDGRVGAIRRKLDESGFSDVAILSYAAKYCSAFYGPFREAAQSAPQFGDRRSYQMDPANVREALKEVQLDLEEGADMVMVKPAMPYLDVIRTVRDRFDVPVGAYNVSGEYAMVKAAARNGWVDEKRVAMEILTGIQRAGADVILTYHAKDAARWLKSC